MSAKMRKFQEHWGDWQGGETWTIILVHLPLSGGITELLETLWKMAPQEILWEEPFDLYRQTKTYSLHGLYMFLN